MHWMISVLLFTATNFSDNSQPEINRFQNPIEEMPIHEEQGYHVILDPLYRTQLSAQIQYPVVKITKRMGDAFKKGEVLIQLDNVILRGYYEKASALVAKAQANRDAKQELFDNNIASFLQLAEAKADLAAAKAEQLIAKKNLLSSEILAPYNGKVVSLAIEEYELPQQNHPIIETVDDHLLLAKFLIPSTLLAKIKIGDELSIHLIETDETIPAKLTRIGAVIDPASSTIKIEAQIDNSENKWKAGMSGTAYLTPASAIPETKTSPTDEELTPTSPLTEPKDTDEIPPKTARSENAFNALVDTHGRIYRLLEQKGGNFFRQKFDHLILQNKHRGCP